MISLKEIGRICGVAESTVSKALKDHPQIKEETRSRVQEVARKYNYQPNALVKSLQSGRSHTVGIAYNNFRDAFAGSIMNGIMERMDDAGYETLIIRWDMIVAKGAQLLTRFSQRRVDGLMLFPSTRIPTPEYLKELRAFQKPVVLIDQTWPGNEFSYVGSDNAGGAAMATRRLVESGLTKIGFIRNTAVSTGVERWDGFLTEMRRHSLPVVEELCPDIAGTPDYGLETVRRTLSAHRRPEGFVCFNDYCALSVFKAAMELGIRVPEDLSIVGFGDLSATMPAPLGPGLTTMDQQPDEIGRRAASMLLSHIEGKELRRQESRVPMRLVERGTVRPLASYALTGRDEP